MKGIPMGIQDFKEIRESDIYFVDKTRLIADILNSSGTKVFLFTRPRRFGKSMNLSMLDAYLNVRYEGNGWFDGLAVSDIRPNDSEKNSNIVVSLDMKDLGNGTYGRFVLKLRNEMARQYVEHLKTEEIQKNHRNPEIIFPNVDTEEGSIRLSESLYDLTKELYKRDGKKVVLLIDEYDNVVNKSEDDSERRRILDFLSEFFGKALKGNEFLKFAVVTGIMRIAKESIFSGLNNLLTDSVLRTTFGEAYGFTPEEVRKLCSDYGHPEKFEEAQQWYDGYRFGDAEVYNPWSVLSYVNSDFRPDTYWAGTSGNDIIDRMMDGTETDLLTGFRDIVKGGNVTARLNDSVAYADITGDTNDVYSIMAASGYLRSVRISDTEYSVSIPNKEMFTVFESMFSKRLKSSGAGIGKLKNAVISGNSEAVAEALTGFAMSIDPKVMSHEHAYEILSIALMMNLEGPYSVENEIHAGKGYCDIRLRSNRRDLPHAIIELKYGKNEDSGESLARSAINQIHEKLYTFELKGTILLYGIAFCDNVASVISETIQQQC